MVKLSVLNNHVSECVGLWLAEGDNKSIREITFTNTCWELIDLFYNTIKKVFKNYNYNPRVYVYSKNKEKVPIPYKNFIVKYYVHKRATRPFFILRFASVKMLAEWKKIVRGKLKRREDYIGILKGLFAGEGNVYMGSHNKRILRISQGKQKDFIDNILNEFGLRFHFEQGNRNYVIYRKRMWDIFAELKLADLHPLKREKFWKVYSSFKEDHYPKNYLIKEIHSVLNEPTTTRELSKKFNRSFERIQDVLILLKDQRKAFNYRIGNIDYWTNNNNLIIISKLKKGYLLFLDRPRQTSDFAKKFGVTWKSSFNRLKELSKRKLVKKGKTGKWIIVQTKKKVLEI